MHPDMNLQNTPEPGEEDPGGNPLAEGVFAAVGEVLDTNPSDDDFALDFALEGVVPPDEQSENPKKRERVAQKKESFFQALLALLPELGAAVGAEGAAAGGAAAAGTGGAAGGIGAGGMGRIMQTALGSGIGNTLTNGGGQPAPGGGPMQAMNPMNKIKEMMPPPIDGQVKPNSYFSFNLGLDEIPTDTDDPEDVDTQEFNDGEKGELQAPIDIEVGGAASPEFTGDILKSIEELLPTIIDAIDKGGDPENPDLLDLHTRLDYEIPGYLDMDDDDDQASKLIQAFREFADDTNQQGDPNDPLLEDNNEPHDPVLAAFDPDAFGTSPQPKAQGVMDQVLPIDLDQWYELVNNGNPLAGDVVDRLTDSGMVDIGNRLDGGSDDWDRLYSDIEEGSRDDAISDIAGGWNADDAPFNPGDSGTGHAYSGDVDEKIREMWMADHFSDWGHEYDPNRELDEGDIERLRGNAQSDYDDWYEDAQNQYLEEYPPMALANQVQGHLDRMVRDERERREIEAQAAQEAKERENQAKMDAITRGDLGGAGDYMHFGNYPNQLPGLGVDPNITNSPSPPPQQNRCPNCGSTISPANGGCPQCGMANFLANPPAAQPAQNTIQPVGKTGSFHYFSAPTRNKQLRQMKELQEQYGPDSSEVVHGFDDGWTVNRLKNYADKVREGEMMNNCFRFPPPMGLSDLWAKHPDMGIEDPSDQMSAVIKAMEMAVERGDNSGNLVPPDIDLSVDLPEDVYSLRDPDGIPRLNYMHGQEPLGNANQPPKPEYQKYLDQWLATQQDPVHAASVKKAEAQGPRTDEQKAAVAELLQQTGREAEIPEMLMQPWNYAEELSQIQLKDSPPESVDPSDPAGPGNMPPPPGPPPGMGGPPGMPPMGGPGMPPPGAGGPPPGMPPIMGSNEIYDSWEHTAHRKQALSPSEAMFPPCPKCGEVAGYSEYPFAKGLLWCNNAACQNIMSPKELADVYNNMMLNNSLDVATLPETEHPLGEHTGSDGNVTTEIAADQIQQQDLSKQNDPSHIWTDTDDSPLKVGREYKMISPAYDIPDIIRVLAIKPDSIEIKITSEFGIDSRSELTHQEVDMEGITFESFDPAKDDQDIPEEDAIYNEATSGDETDLTDTHVFSKAAGASYSPSEQREFINEPGVARNSDKLDLSNTHYRTDAEDDDFIFGW